MDWETVTLDDGRQSHKAETAKGLRLRIYDWKNGRVDWFIYDATGNNQLAEGSPGDPDQAKRKVERALEKLNVKDRAPHT